MLVEQRVLVKVAEWYKDKGKDNKIYYMSPYFAYQANIDPFSEKAARDNMKGFHDKNTPSSNMLNDELILWDGQFSENEGKLKLETLINDKNLIHIKSFYPERKITFYGKEYSAELFRKRKKDFSYFMERIKNDQKWMEIVEKRALELNIPVDSALILDAKHWVDKKKME